MKHWIQTRSGKAIDFENPNPDSIELSDIAWALAHLPRFNGHTERPISVAEHSIGVARIVGKATDDDRYLVAAALLHDASEAYLGDMAAPLKNLVGTAYVGIEDRFMRIIGVKLGIDPRFFHHPMVKKADLIALVTEREVLHGPEIESWGIAEKPDDDYAASLRANPWLDRAMSLAFDFKEKAELAIDRIQRRRR